MVRGANARPATSFETATPFEDEDVAMVFEDYPELVRPKMLALRQLVFSVAKDKAITDLVECLKWSEPSYVCRTGSTVRMDWKAKDEDHYRLFFGCQTSLVSTFRELYTGPLRFEDNRAIRIAVDEKPDFEKLADCIELALRYHKLKHLPLLGRTPDGSS